jgi:phosphatidate cytidylyltransferase
MLKQRVITALALLSVLVPALFAQSASPVALLCLLLCALGAWEWGRLNGLSFSRSVQLATACVILCSACWTFDWFTQPDFYFWASCCALWVLFGLSLLRLGPSGWSKIDLPFRLAGGVLALFMTWLAVVQAKAIGVNFLLSLMALVWFADIGAYFFGRAFGRNKLASTISPGKSWEGVFGGLFVVVIVSFVWIYLDHYVILGQQGDAVKQDAGSPGWSIFSILQSKGLLVNVFALVFIVAMSVVGDLIESLVKRSAGAKDSSNLLPGHGGVLDRLDALLPALPVAMFWSLF